MRFFCARTASEIFSRLMAAAALSVMSGGLATAQSVNAPSTLGEVIPAPLLPKAFACAPALELGDVKVRIAIDEQGNVSDAEPLSGPQSLFPAAEACAKSWKFEHPPRAPETETLVLRYQKQDCPAKESQRGELQYSWTLRNGNNLVIGYIEGQQPPPPPYPDDERKAGIAGRLAVVVDLNADGTVKDAKIIQTLSPRLDQGVIDQLLPLKFKLLDGVSEMQTQGLLFQIVFHATCTVSTIVHPGVGE